MRWWLVPHNVGKAFALHFPTRWRRNNIFQAWVGAMVGSQVLLSSAILIPNGCLLCCRALGGFVLFAAVGVHAQVQGGSGFGDA